MMSIRLRLTLLYSAILALTLIVFGAALYTIQARTTLDALKRELIRGSDRIAAATLWSYQHSSLQPQPEPERAAPVPFETFSSDTAFRACEADCAR
jgi:hypothetical protein